jgi:alkylhydroperoxidase family enzyme
MADRPGPLPASQWSLSVRDAFAPLTPPPDQPRRADAPKGANVLGMQAWHPELSQAFNTFQGYLLYRLALTRRQRELAVLRVSFRRQSDYEWAQHAATAADNGIEPDELARIRQPVDTPGWSDEERLLLQAADELVAEGCIADDTWAGLSSRFDERQLLELIFTVGAYDALAMALRSFGIQLDDDLVGFEAFNYEGGRDGDGR